MNSAKKIPNNQMLVFWLLWVCANSLGFVVGKILADLPYWIYYSIFDPEPHPGGLLTDFGLLSQSMVLGLSVGFSLGFFQWLILRKWIPNFKIWIGVNTFAWFIGVPISRAFIYSLSHDIALMGLVLGFIIGFPGWVVLRKYFNFTIWWIFVWVFLAVLTFGFTITQGYAIPPTDAFIGGIIGVLTGFIMLLLLKHPYKLPLKRH